MGDNPREAQLGRFYLIRQIIQKEAAGWHRANQLPVKRTTFQLSRSETTADEGILRSTHDIQSCVVAD